MDNRRMSTSSSSSEDDIEVDPVILKRKLRKLRALHSLEVAKNAKLRGKLGRLRVRARVFIDNLNLETLSKSKENLKKEMFNRSQLPRYARRANNVEPNNALAQGQPGPGPIIAVQEGNRAPTRNRELGAPGQFCNFMANRYSTSALRRSQRLRAGEIQQAPIDNAPIFHIY